MLLGSWGRGLPRSSLLEILETSCVNVSPYQSQTAALPSSKSPFTMFPRTPEIESAFERTAGSLDHFLLRLALYSATASPSGTTCIYYPIRANTPISQTPTIVEFSFASEDVRGSITPAIGLSIDAFPDPLQGIFASTGTTESATASGAC